MVMRISFQLIIGLSGGLLLLWKGAIEVRIESHSRYHIYVMIEGDDMVWMHFTGIYGNPEAPKRFLTWDLLRRINHNFLGPWICGGDFNEILDSSEKKGGNGKSLEAMRQFQDALDDCMLDDMSKNINTFTWCNGQKDKFILEKLDRFLCNLEWKARYPNANMYYLDWCASDHKAMVLYFGDRGREDDMKRKNKGRFHFEEA